MVTPELAEQIAEDIGHWFKDSKAYQNMISVLPQYAIDYHLAQWVLQVKELRLTAANISRIGRWANSPQRHTFWRDVARHVEYEVELPEETYHRLVKCKVTYDV